MSKTNLEQTGFTFTACGPFTKKQTKKNWKFYGSKK